MLAREVAQLIEPIGDALNAWVLHRHAAEREQRRDNAGALCIKIAGKSVALDEDSVAASLPRGQVAPAVAQVDKIPESALVVSAQPLEVRIDRAFDDQHVPPEMAR